MRWPRGQKVTMWHPDSPGMRVQVWLPWWRRKNREFATLGDVGRMYRSVKDNTRNRYAR